jgi:hypothetical protein
MRSLLVVALHELAKHGPKMLPIQRDEVVQALPA